MLADFRVGFIYRWLRIIEIIEELCHRGGIVNSIGIQLHIKPGIKWGVVKYNLHIILSKIINQLPHINIHFNEVSVWQRDKNDSKKYQILSEIVDIAHQYNIKSIVPWWLELDYNPDRPMPSFEGYTNGHISLEAIAAAMRSRSER